MLGSLVRRVAPCARAAAALRVSAVSAPNAVCARAISDAAIAKGHLHIDDIEGRKSIVKEGRQEFVPECSSAQELVFSWMGWSPEPGTPCWRALHANFPGALPGPAILHTTSRILANHGLRPENTLLGLSICPDEINNQTGHLADSLTKHWGEQFPLGGIGGPPFVGKTGFSAFSHHIADDGHIVILFGPHVGITMDGVVGNVRREGQSQDSTACGAFIAAYNDCVAGCREHSDPHDRQQGFLKEQLFPAAQLIKNTPEPMAALSVYAYEIVSQKMEAIINTDFGDGYLALIGGVQINMPTGFEDHFFPLMFELRARGKPTINLLSELGCEATGKGSM